MGMTTTAKFKQWLEEQKRNDQDFLNDNIVEHLRKAGFSERDTLEQIIYDEIKAEASHFYEGGNSDEVAKYTDELTSAAMKLVDLLEKKPDTLQHVDLLKEAFVEVFSNFTTITDMSDALLTAGFSIVYSIVLGWNLYDNHKLNKKINENDFLTNIVKEALKRIRN